MIKDNYSFEIRPNWVTAYCRACGKQMPHKTGVILVGKNNMKRNDGLVLCTSCLQKTIDLSALFLKSEDAL